MKNLIAVALAAISLLFAFPALAQNSSTATGTASVNVITPITIENTAALALGTVARPLEGTGSITIDAVTGIRTFGGEALAVSGGQAGRGVFVVSGHGNQTFSATIPETVTLTSDTPGQNLTIALTSSVPTALSNGKATIGIGGTLNISSTTPATAYTGNYVVSVSYN